ncbi:hypothetical protein OC834_007419, partial [Tilletia horrida]
MVETPNDLKAALDQALPHARRQPRRAAAAAFPGAGPQAEVVQQCRIGQVGVQVAGIQSVVNQARDQEREIIRLRRRIDRLEHGVATDARTLKARARKIRRLERQLRALRAEPGEGDVN